MTVLRSARSRDMADDESPSNELLDVKEDLVVMRHVLFGELWQMKNMLYEALEIMKARPPAAAGTSAAAYPTWPGAPGLAAGPKYVHVQAPPPPPPLPAAASTPTPAVPPFHELPDPLHIARERPDGCGLTAWCFACNHFSTADDAHAETPEHKLKMLELYHDWWGTITKYAARSSMYQEQETDRSQRCLPGFQ